MPETTIQCLNCGKDMAFVGEFYQGVNDIDKKLTCREFHYCPDCLYITVLVTFPEEEAVIGQSDYMPFCFTEF